MNYKKLNQTRAAYYVVQAFFIILFASGGLYIYSGASCHDAGLITWDESIRRAVIGLELLIGSIPIRFGAMYMRANYAKAARTLRRQQRKEEQAKEIDNKLQSRFTEISKAFVKKENEKFVKESKEIDGNRKYQPHLTDHNGFVWSTEDGIHWTAVGVIDDTIVEKNISLPEGKMEGAV